MGKKYSESLEYKQKMIEKLIRPFCKVNKIIGMDEPYFYRNKVHAVVGGDRKGNIYAGTYEAGSHKIVPIDKCLLVKIFSHPKAILSKLLLRSIPKSPQS